MSTRRERKKELTHRTLLDSALQLFAARGVHATRVEDITERADIGKGVFYNYFDSKEHLVAELVAQGLALLQEKCRESLEAGGSLPQNVARLATAHGTFFAEQAAFGLIFHQARGLVELGGEGVQPIRQVFERYLGWISLVLGLEGHVAVGRATQTNLAAAIVGALFGYRSLCLAADIEPSYQTVASLLALGVGGALRPEGSVDPDRCTQESSVRVPGEVAGE